MVTADPLLLLFLARAVCPLRISWSSAVRHLYPGSQADSSICLEHASLATEGNRSWWTLTGSQSFCLQLTSLLLTFHWPRQMSRRWASIILLQGWAAERLIQFVSDSKFFIVLKCLRTEVKEKGDLFYFSSCNGYSLLFSLSMLETLLWSLKNRNTQFMWLVSEPLLYSMFFLLLECH